MSTKLFVGNLSYDTTEESLRNAFAEEGRQVAKVSIITDRETGRPRGFGFVEMATAEDAEAAMQALNGRMLDGRALTVNEAREREQRGGRGGGGGGGFGGGGRGRDRDQGRERNGRW